MRKQLSGSHFIPKMVPTSTVTYSESLELEERSPQVDLQPQETYVDHSLEPADRGRAAWTLLGVAFVFEALFWGILSTYSLYLLPFMSC